MNRVLFITNLPTPYRIDFYRELGKLCDLTVVIEARRSKDLHFNWNDNDIGTFKLHYLNDGLLNEKKVNWNVLPFLTKDKFDVIVISTYHTYTGMLCLAYLKASGIPYVFETDGGMIADAESSAKKWFKTNLIRGAKAYFSPSIGSDDYLSYYGAKRDCIHRYPFSSLSNSDILHHTLAEEEKLAIRKKLGIKEKSVILAVGQFIHRKGLALVSLEALSSGLPVLGSTNCGGNDAIENGVNGYVFIAGDDNDMIAKIDMFISDVDRIEQMSINARQTSMSYTWERYEENIKEAMNKILANNNQ